MNFYQKKSTKLFELRKKMFMTNLKFNTNYKYIFIFTLSTKRRGLGNICMFTALTKNIILTTCVLAATLPPFGYTYIFRYYKLRLDYKNKLYK